MLPTHYNRRLVSCQSVRCSWHPDMPSAAPLVLGTRNRKKGARAGRAARAALALAIRTLADFPDAIEVDETGDSFAANAALKAAEQARHLERLGAGRGQRHRGRRARAAHRASIRPAMPARMPPTSRTTRKLLAELGDTPLERRTAHYVCQLALSDPRGHDSGRRAAATCHGRIRFEPAGTAGFGYDPLFEIVEYHRTFGRAGRDRSKRCSAIGPGPSKS